MARSIKDMRGININRQPLKWPTIPDGFKLIIDTREQEPLFSPPPVHLEIELRTVHDGDYTIAGLEHIFAVERKKLSDLYSYIGKERTTRTVPKMERFKSMIEAGGWIGLVIELSEDDVLAGNIYSSQMTPNQIYYALCSFEVKTGIHVYYHRDRSMIERYVLSRAVKYYQENLDKVRA